MTPLPDLTDLTPTPTATTALTSIGGPAPLYANGFRLSSSEEVVVIEFVFILDDAETPVARIAVSHELYRRLRENGEASE